jgi:biotin-(acetyl-CoA carboxylase) ligase
VLGIGVNVSASAVPPADQPSFPATSLESELGRAVAQVDALRQILKAILEWRPRLGMPEFMRAWEDALAYRDQPVAVATDAGQPLKGKLLGLEADGSLRLLVQDKRVLIHFGEIHLRPSDDRIG